MKMIEKVAVFAPIVKATKGYLTGKQLLKAGLIGAGAGAGLGLGARALSPKHRDKQMGRRLKKIEEERRAIKEYSAGK